MMRSLSIAATLSLLAAPAFAAEGKPFFSFANTDFIVLVSFLLFIGVLVYMKVPSILLGMLDKRAEGIRSELDEARQLREEAQTLLASFECKAREAEAQAQEIVTQARTDAEAQAAQAQADIASSVERRLERAEEQIAHAEASARARVQVQAANMAVSAAREVIAGSLSPEARQRLTDEAIASSASRLN